LTASFDECVSCGADQIGHLERWPTRLTSGARKEGACSALFAFLLAFWTTNGGSTAGERYELTPVERQSRRERLESKRLRRIEPCCLCRSFIREGSERFYGLLDFGPT